MADILTPWTPFGDGFQQSRTDCNLNAEIKPVLGGYHWLVYDLLASARTPIALVGGDKILRVPSRRDRYAIRSGSTPLGMTDAEALDKAKADATAALLKAR